jgi:hypothetical protein
LGAKTLRSTEGDRSVRRDQLFTYFEAMGCTHLSDRGKGSHEMIILPGLERGINLDFFGFDGEGGALTVARITDKVPPYFMKQLQSAREYLKVYAEKNGVAKRK